MKTIKPSQRIPQDPSFTQFIASKENRKDPSKSSKPIRAMEYMLDYKNSFDLNAILLTNDNSQDLTYETWKKRQNTSGKALRENSNFSQLFS